MTSLAHETGEVIDAADRFPGALPRHGRLRYIVLRIAEFDRLTARGIDPRRSLTTDRTPDDILALLANDLATL
jgi:hypothetical protein